MIRCIRLCLDCANICLATRGILSRQTAFDPSVARVALQACALTCTVCGDEREVRSYLAMASLPHVNGVVASGEW
jgi:hypothetical protein